MKKNYILPDYLFEVSWEVCNKVGGIHTVVSSKAHSITEELNDRYLLIGPDVWKETHSNPEFDEDHNLFRDWIEHASVNSSFHIRAGYWNVPGRPIVLLVDFTPYFGRKDQIFAEFWENYQLDSITGQWDYAEPVLFGYSAAKVIESFYNYYLTARDSMVAHFHEWMTASGVLYLKKNVPQAGTIFTTHATMLGRTISGNNLPLYQDLANYNNQETARRFNIVAKNSMETIVASVCDCFATVSETTAKECKYLLGKEVDVVTPNGFEKRLVPATKEFNQKRKQARNTLTAVSQAIMNHPIDDDALFIINSGRYEFRNKGIDTFIDALGQLNKSGKLKKQLIAILTIPADHREPDQELVAALNSAPSGNAITRKYLTHRLNNPQFDPILEQIKKNDLLNRPEDQVKIIFAPVYLNGKDGVFNLAYYDLLIGFDLSVFPSYYEPWGYTPMESIAFAIPTITTNCAGFGKWAKVLDQDITDAIIVLDRDDSNYDELTVQISHEILKMSNLSQKDSDAIRKKAMALSNEALWENLFSHYEQAYTIALEKVAGRTNLFKDKLTADKLTVTPVSSDNNQTWRKLLIQTNVPESLFKLKELIYNLWWTWTDEAKDLFESIDPQVWNEYDQNPIQLLESLSFDRMQALEKDQDFMNRLDAVYNKFRAYMDEEPKKDDDLIAYFCMEYGIHQHINIYSGGLGILAGDYLKEASDTNTNMVAVGLLYRYGYFTQKIANTGQQNAKYVRQRYSKLPIKPVLTEDGEWLKIGLAMPGRVLYARSWWLDVGRIRLFLLDADIDENTHEDRSITYQLYGGDNENRLKQEMLLGISGIRLLEALQIKPTIYHSNEGHSAFIGMERINRYVTNDQYSFELAVELVRTSTLFTSHTPVPAGHDVFHEDMLRRYISHYSDHLGISWDALINLGKMIAYNPNEKFSMSILAARLSQEMNGVSMIHGQVTRDMFTDLQPGFLAEELHIGYVTNGVHCDTWTARQWKDIFRDAGIDYQNNPTDFEGWKKLYNIPDSRIWETRLALKSRLMEYLKQRIMRDMTKRQETPQLIFRTLESINPEAFVVGFARRFATYKRAFLLFENLDRLADILNNDEQPLMFVFAGKAHPNDKMGQDLIKRIVEVSKMDAFIGKVVFIENYNIEVAQMLVQGADLWLNTPTRLMEASGTSGQKAAFNGVINCSVLDGWWVEGYHPGGGYGLALDKTFDNQQVQDQLDAETLYNMIENDILPMYFNRNGEGYNPEWIQKIKYCVAEIAPHFSTTRMLDDYKSKYYSVLINRTKLLSKDKNKLAKEIVEWKQKIRENFEHIEVLELKLPHTFHDGIKTSESFMARVKLDLKELSPEEVGIDIIFQKNPNEKNQVFVTSRAFKVSKVEKNIVTYACDMLFDKAGLYNFSIRVYPTHKLLPHKQDLNLLKWI